MKFTRQKTTRFGILSVQKLISIHAVTGELLDLGLKTLPTGAHYETINQHPEMRAKRVDENQATIVNVLRQIPGCVVTDLSGCGEGVPDLIVSYENVLYWFEIKNPNLRWQLKPAQVKFHAEQKNVANVDVHIVTTVKQALEILGLNPLSK